MLGWTADAQDKHSSNEDVLAKTDRKEEEECDDVRRCIDLWIKLYGYWM